MKSYLYQKPDLIRCYDNQSTKTYQMTGQSKYPNYQKLNTCQNPQVYIYIYIYQTVKDYIYQFINRHKVPATKEIFFSRTFPVQNFYFPGQNIQDLKVINQDMREKAYHIYSMYDRLLKFLWYSLLLTLSSSHPLLFKF